MIDPVVVGLVSAVTALVASVTGPLVTLYIGRSQIRASVLAANRQKWIESFREAIATFCAQIAAIVHTREKILADGRIRISSDPEMLHRLENLILTFTRIRLLTDPLDEDHHRLLGDMQELLRFLQAASPTADIQSEVEAAVGKIVEASLRVLRREWARVKRLD
ncbi:hypothetical protein [Variovorax sp. dw_954]|uniref:hypothetical protein n=1 Tax=Variovorax sp. dw_954 TaxID=2720078 RepID=UPI001BD50681|nr:hypothetical protein [Variovorax sp. dw_954]